MNLGPAKILVPLVSTRNHRTGGNQNPARPAPFWAPTRAGKTPRTARTGLFPAVWNRNIICRVVVILLFCLCPLSAFSDETLGLYGLKGYAYTYSPLPARGLHLQTGVMYSRFETSNLNCRDGFIWVIPVSLTYGDGDRFEGALATHMEYWENTYFDVNESGTGDLFWGERPAC